MMPIKPERQCAGKGGYCENDGSVQVNGLWKCAECDKEARSVDEAADKATGRAHLVTMREILAVVERRRLARINARAEAERLAIGPNWPEAPAEQIEPIEPAWNDEALEPGSMG